MTEKAGGNGAVANGNGSLGETNGKLGAARAEFFALIAMADLAHERARASIGIARDALDRRKMAESSELVTR